MSYDALDDFAGPGGWDEGARMVGLKDVGIEWDHAACHTAVKAGHARIRADVAIYPSAPFRGIPGYISSPPCTLFSSAGSGVGNLVIDALVHGVERMLKGEDCREEVRAAIYPVTFAEREKANEKRTPEKRWTQERVETTARMDAFIASLVLEPARRIHELHPEWIALEQVPEVLPIWQTYVRVLRTMGYSAWTGVLNAANYGVPQTRERAICMASRVRKVAPPAPTHSRDGDEGDLFGEAREKWVSMARALGWDTPVRFGNQKRAAVRQPDEPAATVLFGNSPADKLVRFVAAGVTGEGRPKDPESQPADTLTGKGTAYWIESDRPAPTLTTTRRSKDGMLVGRQLPPGEGENVGGKNWVRMGNQEKSAVRHVEEPAPTVLFGARSNKVEWFHDRPATTVVGSFKPEIISPPGYRTSTSRQNAEGGVRVTVAEGGVRVTVAEGGVRVTVAEGGVLQSFPADYPWQGSRTKQYQQVGNAIPPRLAAHVLAALTGRELRAVA